MRIDPLVVHAYLVGLFLVTGSILILLAGLAIALIGLVTA